MLININFRDLVGYRSKLHLLSSRFNHVCGTVSLELQKNGNSLRETEIARSLTKRSSNSSLFWLGQHLSLYLFPLTMTNIIRNAKPGAWRRAM